MSNYEGTKKTQIPFGHKIFGTKPNDGDVQPRHGWSYAIAGFGQNLVCSVIGSYLPIFMTDGVGFAALSVALLMLFTRFYDAFNDPIMGSIVDRTKTKWGKCRPYLFWTPIPIAIATVLCFLPVFKNNAGSFAAATVLYLAWTMLYTAIDVPYWGLSTTMTNNTYKRSNLLTVARLISTLGAGVVTVIVPLITDNLTRDISYKYDMASKAAHEAVDESARAALQKIADGFAAAKGAQLQKIYFVIAIVLAVVSIPLLMIGFWGTKEIQTKCEKTTSLKENLKLLFSNKPLLLIVLSGVLGSARMVFAFAGGIYFAKYVWSNVEFLHIGGVPLFKGESLFTLITVAVVPGGLIASVLIPLLTRKMGKKQPYIWSHIIVGILMLIVFFVGLATDKGNYAKTSTVVLVFIAIFLSGIPAGISNIASYAMIGDTVDYLELHKGKRAEGICFAMQTFINKSGLAVGAFIGILAYNTAGIKPNAPGSLDGTGKDKFWAMLMLFAALSTIATAIPMFFYKFGEKEQREAREIIDKRNKEAEEMGLVDECGEPIVKVEIDEEVVTVNGTDSNMNANSVDSISSEATNDSEKK